MLASCFTVVAIIAVAVVLLLLIVAVVLITPPLPRDGGTARTAIQGHAVNLIEIREKMAAHFESVMSD